jgi:hypothetical protein
MPSSDQNTPDSIGATQVADAGQEAEPATVDEGQELPEGVKERTAQQFDKLKKELAVERERRMRLERTFPSAPSTSELTKPDWYDESTGLVDVTKLSQREANLRRELSQVKTQLQGFARLTEIQQEKEAYAVYPELDPNGGKLDEKFQKQVVSYLATAFADGQNPTLKEAADEVMSWAKKLANKAEADGARKALEQLSPKEQASLEATGRSDRRLPSVDFDEIRATTRRGGRAGIEATMQRIANIKPVGK